MDIEWSNNCEYEFLQIATSEGYLKLCGNLADYSKVAGPICIHTESSYLKIEFVSIYSESGTVFSFSFFHQYPTNFSESLCGKKYNRSEFKGMQIFLMRRFSHTYFAIIFQFEI